MNPTGRMSYGEKALCVGATIAMLIIVYFTATEPRGKVVTSEQFPAELAEQNRQADVASQIRGAEPGDYAEMTDGSFRMIGWKNQDGDLTLCQPTISCTTTNDLVPAYAAKRRIKQVIKLYGDDQKVLAAVRQWGNQLRPRSLPK